MKASNKKKSTAGPDSGPPSPPSNRRVFLRVLDSINISFHDVPLEQYPARAGAITSRPTTRRSSLPVGGIHWEAEHWGDGYRAERLNPALHAYLRRLNRKLDLITELLANRAEDARWRRRVLPVEISASGMKLIVPEKPGVRENDFIEFKLRLPVFPHRLVRGLGVVLRREKNEAGEGWLLITKFTALNEDDREAIVQYVFRREREMLRAQSAR